MAISRPLQSTATVQRNLAQARLRRKNVEQVRSLWWWGGQGKSWWSSQHEDIEERMARHQKIMMQRYSKALRRRSMWEREHSPPAWSWRLPSRLRAIRLDRKDMSSTEQLRAKLEEHENPKRDTGRPWEEFHKDFESFKAAVDKAIERDPYGTLFGKRLRSPPTANNSSWTSWSWIFDPKDIKEEKPVIHEAPEKDPSDQASSHNAAANDSSLHTTPTPQPSESNAEPSATAAKTIQKYSSIKTETIMTSGLQPKQISVQYSGEYVYDPISGRKVLKQTPHISASKSKPLSSDQSSSKPVIQTDTTSTPFWKKLFFTEHGAKIPVKVYEPKVYGFDAKNTASRTSDKAATDTKDTKSSAFENSRKHQCNQLRASMLGNTIDSSNFDERWTAKKVSEELKAPAEEIEEKPNRTSPAPDDAQPLFSGTAYEERALENDLAPSATTSDWLVREGFSRKAPLTIPDLAPKPSPSGVPREPTSKLEPSLDRVTGVSDEIPVKKFKSKLQPSLDRAVKQASTKDSMDKQFEINKAREKREDIDLLRASDVRAAAKAARITKQALEERKRDTRFALEKDFESRAANEQRLNEYEAVPTTSARTEVFSQSLSNVWKHIKQYPSGIVAKTMRTMGIAQDHEDTKPNSTIMSKQPEELRTAINPSRVTNGVAINPENERLIGLAQSLKAVLEEENGIIDDVAVRLAAPRTDSDTKRARMNPPSIKPGISRDLDIEKHTQKFEPRLAEMVDRANSVKRELHDISPSIDAVESQRAVSAVTDRQRNEVATETSPSNTTSVKINVDESKQNTGKIPDFDSPYILLSYSREVDDVQVTPLRTLMGSAAAQAAKVNPIAAIGSLNKPGSFVKHFVDLDKHGYELTGGSGEMLVFRNQSNIGTTSAETKEKVHAVQNHKVASPPELDDDTIAELSLASLTSTAGLRKTIAMQEAASQPRPPTEIGKQQDSLKAARVLDEIPTTIPTPGPSAPTAPPTSSISRPSSAPATHTSTSSSTASDIKVTSKPLPGSRPSRVRRQEQVFSGQRLPSNNSTPVVQPDPSAHFPTKPTPAATASEFQASSSSATDREHPNFMSCFSRAIRRIVLTAIAFGTGAYAIGVITEGLGAQAQHNQITGDGPRKKIVVSAPEVYDGSHRQRPGIFSTESSR